jgi:hypothetical protein
MTKRSPQEQVMGSQDEDVKPTTFIDKVRGRFRALKTRVLSWITSEELVEVAAQSIVDEVSDAILDAVSQDD